MSQFNIQGTLTFSMLKQVNVYKITNDNELEIFLKNTYL